MVRATSRDTKAGPRPNARKFYAISENFQRGGRVGVRLENKDVIGRYLHYPKTDPHYLEYPERPLFLFDRKIGRPPRDLEGYVGHWLLSDPMKEVLEAVDRHAFAFTSCDVRLPGGEPGPHRWLCTVLRVLDALDDEASQVKIDEARGRKFYMLNPGMTRLVFRDDVVGAGHIFRMAYRESVIICDQTMKDACQGADLTGVLFRDVREY